MTSVSASVVVALVVLLGSADASGNFTCKVGNIDFTNASAGSCTMLQVFNGVRGNSHTLTFNWCQPAASNGCPPSFLSEASPNWPNVCLHAFPNATSGMTLSSDGDIEYTLRDSTGDSVV